MLTYPILYYVVRYRRRVVAQNLRLSFPEMSDRERKALERKFYHHLVDIVAEIIWSYRASEEQMRAHFVAPNVDEVERWAQQKGGVIFMLGHLGNWEWTADVQQRFEQPNMQHSVSSRATAEVLKHYTLLTLSNRSSTSSISGLMRFRHSAFSSSGTP